MTPCVRRYLGIVFAVALVLGASACVRQPAPVTPSAPAPPPGAGTTPAPPPPAPPPVPRAEADPPPARVPEDDFATRSLEDLNRQSPLGPVFFAYDSFELDDRARTALKGNASLLTRYPAWTVTIEGHCDERGSAEYNLALGERRALAARNYLVEIGLPAGRLRTVSYGKEFPFDPGHTDEAWAKNRRAYFVITAK